MKDKITINTQSSIRIAGNQIICFDPFKISDRKNDADLIFITHDHYDHLDPTSINNIKKESTCLVVPKSIRPSLANINIKDENIIEVEPNQTYLINGYKVETIPSYNLVKPFHPKDKNYVGYIITIDNERIYVSGDTDNTIEAQQVKCDIALIPIGGTYTMDYQEASELIKVMKPKVVIPTHYGNIVGTLQDGELFKDNLKNVEVILKLN